MYENKLEETDSIFSKFKRISEPLPEVSPEPNAAITLQEIYNKLLELERRMTANHAEFIAHLTR